MLCIFLFFYALHTNFLACTGAVSASFPLYRSLDTTPLTYVPGDGSTISFDDLPYVSSEAIFNSVFTSYISLSEVANEIHVVSSSENKFIISATENALYGNTSLRPMSATSAKLEFYDSDSSNVVTFAAPADITTSYDLEWPATAGITDGFLGRSGASGLSFRNPTKIEDDFVYTGTRMAIGDGGPNVYMDIGGSRVASYSLFSIDYQRDHLHRPNGGASTGVWYYDGDATNYLRIAAPTDITTTYSLTWPPDSGVSGGVLARNGINGLIFRNPLKIEDDFTSLGTRFAIDSGANTMYADIQGSRRFTVYSSTVTFTGNIGVAQSGGVGGSVDFGIGTGGTLIRLIAPATGGSFTYTLPNNLLSIHWNTWVCRQDGVLSSLSWHEHFGFSGTLAENQQLTVNLVTGTTYRPDWDGLYMTATVYGGVTLDAGNNVFTYPRSGSSLCTVCAENHNAAVLYVYVFSSAGGTYLYLHLAQFQTKCYTGLLSYFGGNNIRVDLSDGTASPNVRAFSVTCINIDYLN